RDRQVCELLIAHGADVNWRGEDRWTPLHRVAHQEDCDSAAVLIDYWADLEAEADGRDTPLLLAARATNDTMAEYLLSRGARLDLNSTLCLGKADDARAILRTGPSSVVNALQPQCLLTDFMLMLAVRKSRLEQEYRKTGRHDNNVA